MDEIFLTIFGSIGLLLILLGYYLEHFKGSKLFFYDLFNFFGALILTIYAWILSDSIFVFLESVWTIVAGYYLFVNFFGDKK